MRFWFVHSGEVSLREQICTQVTLGIVSAELRPGQRLPSTREMGRRFGLHPNTVSAAYQQLQEEGKVERRHGAGVFVRDHTPAADREHGSRTVLDRMIAEFLTAARAQGFSREAVTERVRRWMEVKAPDHFLVVEPEPERREILLAELREAVRFPVRGCSVADCAQATAAIAVALPSKAAMVRAALPAPVELVTLQVTSVPAELREWLPARTDALVGIVSRWPEFIKIARTVLVASGFSADALTERIRGEDGWKEGLSATAGVVCDAATVKHLPEKVRAIPFRLVSETTLEELRRLEKNINESLKEK
ncbi:MAG TPA: GntR family transcriptional regulator [Acidobacteriaceae bacterium]|jgi:GntR family transcriptional regulator